MSPITNLLITRRYVKQGGPYSSNYIIKLNIHVSLSTYLLNYILVKLKNIKKIALKHKEVFYFEHSLLPFYLMHGKLLLKVSSNAHQSISVNFHSSVCMYVRSFWLTLFESIDYYDIPKGGRIIHKCIPFVGNSSIFLRITHTTSRNRINFFKERHF